MAVLFPVLAGVAILRIVATADLPAHEAGSQVDPRVPGGNALFTDIRLGMRLCFEVAEVVAGSRHAYRFSECEAPDAGGPHSASVVPANRPGMRPPSRRGR